MCVKHFAAKRRRLEKLEYCLLKDNFAGKQHRQRTGARKTTRDIGE
jgi:hypothetical protein